jgi:hypothetical protein
MKTRASLTLLLIIALFRMTFGQNVSARSGEFEVDFTDAKKLLNTRVPVITWMAPTDEVSYTMDVHYKIKIEIECLAPLKNVYVIIKDKVDSAPKGKLSIAAFSEEEKKKITVERVLTLTSGSNIIEVIAENEDGARAISRRKIHIGSTTVADAASLDRNDYALLFTTNDYDNWPDLVNPVNDGKMLAEELKSHFGFNVEIVEGGSQNDILKKIREYAEKKYLPLDQLLIFFAGHGQFDNTFGEGFVVTKESLTNDEAKTTYLSHNRLRSIINNIPCQHIFLVMDVCFGGTFDASVAHRGLDDEVYKEASQSEMVMRKLTYKTRRYLTSGGKEYVPDGAPGMNSPFTRKLLGSLRSMGGKDLILTMSEIESAVETLKPQPRSGEFGDNAPGSDFVFVGRSK